MNTIKNWLHAELISVKNIREHIVNMNCPENRVKTANYITEFFQYRAEGRTFVWVDETNFNLYCNRKEGRSKVGTRASIVMPASKLANLHCIGTMTIQPILSGLLLDEEPLSHRTVLSGLQN